MNARKEYFTLKNRKNMTASQRARNVTLLSGEQTDFSAALGIGWN